MADADEVAVTCDASNRLWSICIWDLETGSVLKSYKGGDSAPHTLAFLGCDYLLSAQKNHPVINVWTFHSKEQMRMKMICPGRVSALAISPNNCYCVAGIQEKIHIWQISSGRLLCVISRHYRPLTTIKFSDDSSHFVTASEDTLVLVWSLVSVLSENAKVMGDTVSCVQPKHTWSHHSLPVTDVCVGRCGCKARAATCSLDQTAKLYELLSGQLLLSVLLDDTLTSVVMDPAEYFLFVGGSTGNIYQVNLFSPPRTIEQNFTIEQEEEQLFQGHSKPITGLTVTMDGRRLFSGSEDETAKLWHIPSRQCIKTFTHKGSVSNVAIIPAWESISTAESVKCLLPIEDFQRHLVGSRDEGALSEHENEMIGSCSVRIFPSNRDKGIDVAASDLILQDGDGIDENIMWKDEALKLKTTNFALYRFAVEKILNEKT